MLARGVALLRIMRAAPCRVSRGVVFTASAQRRAPPPTQFTAVKFNTPGRVRWLSSAHKPHHGKHLTRLRSVPVFTAAFDAAGANDAVDCIRITRLSGADVGALSDVLLSLGSTAVSVEDADLGTLDEKEVYAGDKKLWRNCNVTAMFAPESDIDTIMKDAAEILCAKVDYQPETIPGDDWVNVVLDSFNPVQVSEKLWIVPAWTEQLTDTSKECTNVILEPGLAFGTGEHPTTRLCLKWLRDDSGNFKSKNVLDFGTGSGVLAIGALLMGAKTAVGVDMEAQSVEAAMRNAALNSVDKNLTTYLADGSDNADLPPGRKKDEEKFDVVVANILIGPVLQLAALFAEYCAPGGRVCLSGVLVTQTSQVLEAYAPFFDDLKIEEELGWAVVYGTRKEV